MRTILAAVDLSKHSDAVVARAAELASILQENLVLLTVLDPDPMKKFSLDEERKRIAGFHKELIYKHFRKTGIEVGSKEAAGNDYIYRPVGIRIRSSTVSGKTDDAICSFADQVDADLVIVGNRGLGNVAGLVLGSVSERVVHKCNRTVMVVKGEYEDKENLESLLDSYKTRKVGTS